MPHKLEWTLQNGKILPHIVIFIDQNFVDPWHHMAWKFVGDYFPIVSLATLPTLNYVWNIACSLLWFAWTLSITLVNIIIGTFMSTIVNRSHWCSKLSLNYVVFSWLLIFFLSNSIIVITVIFFLQCWWCIPTTPNNYGAFGAFFVSFFDPPPSIHYNKTRLLQLGFLTSTSEKTQTLLT